MPTPASENDCKAAIRAALETTRNIDSIQIAERLGGWLADRGGGSVTSLSPPLASGSSSELFICELTDTQFAGAGLRRVVLRLVGDRSAYPSVDLARQVRCQQTISERCRAPAPAILTFEASPDWLGTPFVVMEEARGNGAPDFPSYVAQGWIADLSAAERSMLWQNGIDAIAALHLSDIGDARDDPDLRLGNVGDALGRLIGYWKDYLAVVHQAGTYPVLDHAVQWLADNRPDIPDRNVMIWGDASLRNMLFDGLEVSALLDFEFAHVGLPQFEIAFYAMMDYLMAEAYSGLPRLDGFWDAGRTFAYYEQLTGFEIGDPEYFCRMAVTYSSLANTRVFQHLASDGRMANADVGRNPPLLYLAEMFGIPGLVGS